jgi:hypothetical protein
LPEPARRTGGHCNSPAARSFEVWFAPLLIRDEACRQGIQNRLKWCDTDSCSLLRDHFGKHRVFPAGQARDKSQWESATGMNEAADGRPPPRLAPFFPPCE